MRLQVVANFIRTFFRNVIQAINVLLVDINASGQLYTTCTTFRLSQLKIAICIYTYISILAHPRLFKKSLQLDQIDFIIYCIIYLALQFSTLFSYYIYSLLLSYQ